MFEFSKIDLLFPNTLLFVNNLIDFRCEILIKNLKHSGETTMAVAIVLVGPVFGFIGGFLTWLFGGNLVEIAFIYWGFACVSILLVIALSLLRNVCYHGAPGQQV